MLIVLKLAHVNPVLEHKRLNVTRNTKNRLAFYLIQSLMRQLNLDLVVEVHLKLGPPSLTIQAVALLNQRNAILV